MFIWLQCHTFGAILIARIDFSFYIGYIKCISFHSDRSFYFTFWQIIYLFHFVIKTLYIFFFHFEWEIKWRAFFGFEKSIKKNNIFLTHCQEQMLKNKVKDFFFFSLEINNFIWTRHTQRLFWNKLKWNALKCTRVCLFS